MPSAKGLTLAIMTIPTAGNGIKINGVFATRLGLNQTALVSFRDEYVDAIIVGEAAFQLVEFVGGAT